MSVEEAFGTLQAAVCVALRAPTAEAAWLAVEEANAAIRDLFRRVAEHIDTLEDVPERN